MAFDPRQHLAFAQRSLSASDDEAASRVAINRAYYAAFLVARAYVDQGNWTAKPPAGRRWGSHERVIFSLGMVPDPATRSVRKALLRLKRLRVNADYDLDYAEAGEDAIDAVLDAEWIIAWIDALP